MKLYKILSLFMIFCMVLSLSAFASEEMPDTSLGGQATMAPGDNSTRAIDVMGTRAALYFEYSEDGYILEDNSTDAYEVTLQGDIAVPTIGEAYTLDGLYIHCSAEEWDAENKIGNSAIVVNSLTDSETPFYIGGSEDYYEAPNGESYNTVIILDVEEDEELADASVSTTSPGVPIAYNGSCIELNNVYIESTGDGRPCIFTPASTRDANCTQAGGVVLVESYLRNYTTRGSFFMGGDVYSFKSTVIANNRGSMVFDNTSANMYIVDSDIESLDARGYSVYDAAGCVEYFYGIRAVAGGSTLTVCRDAVLYIGSLDEVPDEVAARYDGDAVLTDPIFTEDGYSFIAGGYSAVMIHADSAGADTQVEIYASNTVFSTLTEDIVFYDGEEIDMDTADQTYVDEGAVGYLQWLDLNGAAILFRCHSGKVVLDNCELRSRTGIAILSTFYYDGAASGIFPIDGAEYVGDEVDLQNMTVEGDVIHNDYMRKMDLSLENTTLVGAVVSGTCASWNAKYADIDMDALEAAGVDLSDTDEETIKASFIYNDTYETIWGVRMSMDADSIWEITGDSNLYSFVMEDGAVIQAPEGMALTIYVDCAMSGDAVTYDTATGTQIDAFEPGVEYTGVVIVMSSSGSGEASEA